jgi:transposase
MANKRIKMNKLRDILRLKAAQATNKSISRQLRLWRTTMIRYLKQITASGLSYTQLLNFSDAELSVRFAPSPQHVPPTDATRYEALSSLLESFEKELTRTGVTRRLLWQQYLGQHPQGYQFTQFCHHYSRWKQSQQVHMHLEQVAGEKLYVDFCGKKLLLTHPATGQQQAVEILVCVLSGSQYTYVEAVESASDRRY